MYAVTTSSPNWLTSWRSSAAPFSFAAIWARRSARLAAGFRDRELRRGEQLRGGGLAHLAPRDETPVVDEHALLLDPGAEGGHGAGRDAADLRVVPAGGHVEQDVLGVPGERSLPEHGGDHGDVGQVRAAVVGVVEHEDVARLHGPRVAADDHLDALAHRAQVHRHVRGVGDQLARRVEDRAGEVEALLDVDRVRGALQPDAHLLGHGHEEVVEDLQHDRVGGGAGAGSCRAPTGPGQQQVTAAGHRGVPARLHHCRGEVLGDQGGAGDHAPGTQRAARQQADLGPVTAGEHPDPGRGPRAGGARGARGTRGARGGAPSSR